MHRGNLRVLTAVLRELQWWRHFFAWLLLSPFNIHVNAIAPGIMETDMISTLSKEQLDIEIKRTPLGRMVKVEEIMAAVNYLLSEEAAVITGQILTIDGGINL